MTPSDQSNTNHDFEQELCRISDLFENTKINYHVLDEAGQLIFVNQPWLKTLGYDKDEVIGSPFINLLNRGSKLLFKQAFNKCCEQISHDKLELTLQCADGSEIIALFTCFSNPEILGSSLRHYCTFQNITKLKDTEKALYTSEQNYERIFKSFRDVYYRADPESRILLVSPSVEHVSGYRPEELIGRSLADFFVSTEERSDLRTQLIGNGYIDDYCLKLRKKNGQHFDASISAQIVKNTAPEDFYVEGVIRDISQRKKNELEIESSTTRLNDVTEKLPVVLFQLNQKKDELKFDYLSSNVDRLLGISAKEILADAAILASLLSKQVLNDILFEFSMAQKGKRTAELDFKIRSKKGELLWCKIKASFSESVTEGIKWTGVAIDITEEACAKQKIRKQEEQLKALHHFANVGIATSSLTGILTSVNPAISEITGYSASDLVGKHFKDSPVFLKKDIPLYMKLFANALRGVIPEEGIPFQWKHSSGEKRWAEAYLNLIREEGKIKGFQGVFLDITDRILLDKERSTKHHNNKFLFDSALGFSKIHSEKELYQFLTKQMRKLIPEAIININSVNDDRTQLRIESVTGLSSPVRSGILKLIGTSLKGKLFDINPETFQYAKHGKLVQIHDNLYELALHQIPDTVCKPIEKLIRLREIHEISLGVGDRIMGGCAIFLCSDQKLENIHLVENLFRQATETLSRVQSHHKLEQREELYRSLAENCQDTILRVNERKEVIYANQTFLTTFELQTKDILNQPIKLFGFPSAISNLINKTIEETNSSQLPQSCDIVLGIGEATRFFEWRMFPENNKGNGIRSVLMFVHNITRRKEAEARIMNNVENKNKIFRLIGHDLKNPFSSILGFLDILTQKYDTLSDDLKKKYLEYIRESSHNLHLLLVSLQEWSMGDDQHDHFKPIFFDLKDLIDSSIEFTKLSVVGKGLILKNTVPPGTLIKADYNMIAAAFRNLLANACKFSPQGGEVVFSLSRNPKEAIIEIRDQGTGMSKEEIEQLLHTGESFSKTGTQGESGSGLGFKFAKDFIERNKGWIKIKSQAGSGTQVFLGFKTK